MGKSGKKARKKNLDPRRINSESGGRPKKKEADWSFEDIVRSKSRGR